MTASVDLSPTTYTDRPVLVTGGASFIGSHLAEGLVKAGAKVTIIDDLSSGSLEHLKSIRPEVHFVQANVSDPNAATHAVSGQEIVFHLAAVHGGRGFVDTRGAACLANLRIDNVLFEAISRTEVKKVVFASSACAYPTYLQGEPGKGYQLRETDAGFTVPGHAFPDGAYGWTKLIGELQLEALHLASGISSTVCRLFSVYGERQTVSHSVAALIARALARDTPYVVWGDGEQTRNYTYVSDVVRGLMACGLYTAGWSIINIGRSDTRSINELIEAIFVRLDWRPAAVAHDLAMPVGVRHRSADISRAADLIGWTPRVTLDEGLDVVLDWYRRHPSPLTSELLFAQG